MDYETWLVSLVTATFICYLYVHWKLSFWKRKGVEYYSPRFLNFRVYEVSREAYASLKSRGVKLGGTFLLVAPLYVPVDLDVLKGILQTDFDHFYDRTGMANPEVDPITGNLLDISGEKWKRLRGKMSPAFTTGKIKMMFQPMVESSLELVKLLDKHTSMDKTLHMKQILLLFTVHVIGSCAFGIETGTLSNSLSKYKKIADASIADVLKKVLFNMTLPDFIVKKFKLTSTELESFYLNLVRDTFEHRRSTGVQRNDFMRILMEMEDGGLSVEEMAAQCYVFFIGGFETSSSAMTMALLELARHQEVQERLREEIARQPEGVTYESVMEMEYLDQVVNETLRLHPPVKTLPRICTKDYPVPGTDILIKKGERMLISYEAIHSDPEYYPEPEKFDPERFSKENKGKLVRFTFLPFGEGPRHCIAFKFGLMQIKVGLMKILSNFKISLNSKTKFPLVYDNLGLNTKDGIWLDVERLT